MEPWQTRATEFHPYMVDAVEALPENLREVARTAVPRGQQMVRMFVVPADYRAEGRSESHAVPPQALIYTDVGVVHIRAAQTGATKPLTVSLRADELLSLRSSHLLLYGRLEMIGSAKQTAATIDVEFNAVGWRLMETEWHGLVAKAIGFSSAKSDAAVAEHQPIGALLESIPMKFIDGVQRYGLYTGETLMGALLQPAIWKESLLLFDEQVTPDTLLALTNASVLVLEEDHALVRKSDQSGLIITRMPLRALVGVQSKEVDSLQEITFSLSRAGATAEHRLLLEPATAKSWLALWERRGSIE